MISKLLNPPTMRPTLSIEYYALNPSGAILEQQTKGMPVVNTIAGVLNACTNGILPQSKSLDQAVPYILTLTFNNYEQNANVVIQVPPEIQVPGSVQCVAVQGIVQALSCQASGLQITIKDFVTYQPTNPGTVKIQINNLINPKTEIVASGFIISTTTAQGNIIDTLGSLMPIDFRCSDRCASCNSLYKDQCTACYPTSANSHLNSSQRTCDSACSFGNSLAAGDGSNSLTCNICGIPGSAQKLAVHASLLLIAIIFIL